MRTLANRGKGRIRGKRQNKIFICICVLIIAICFGFWKLWHSDEMQMRFVYIWPYQQEILQYSENSRIDPFLIAAIIKNESNFNNKAVSNAGAVGLMQIMPETGKWIAGQMDLTGYNDQDLYKSRTNIRMGCWYVGELDHEFRHNFTLMMIAYNAGRGKTKEWMRINGWNYNFNDVKSIPYADTRTYVTKVLYDRDKYYSLYKDKVGSD